MANSELSALLKQFEGMSYNAPDISKSMDFDNYKAPSYKKFNYTPYDFTAKDFGSLVNKKKKVDAGVNIWDMLSSTFGLPGGLVTRGANNFLEDMKGFDKDKPLKSTLGVLANLNLSNVIGEALVDGGKKQWSNWTDDKLSWGDIPGIGLLDGINETSARGSDIMENLGVKNKWGKVGGGLAIDILADPLTYMTGGLSTASKLGKAKEIAEIAKHSKNLGITQKVKNVEEFKDVLIPALQKKYAKYPSLADRMVEKKFDEIIDSISNTRNKVYNDNINKFGVSIPFSNKMTAPLGNISKRNLTHRSEATLGADFAHVAENLLKDHGVKSDVLKKLFNKSNASDLTKTELDALTSMLTKASSKLKTHNSGLRNLPDADIFEVGVLGKKAANTSEVLKTTSGLPSLNKTLQLTGDVGKGDQEIIRMIRDADVKVGNRNAGKKGIEDFIEKEEFMNNAKTKFEHFLDRKNPFDARTLKTGNAFVNSMADHIADGNSQRVGENAKYMKGLGDVEKYIKKNGITPDEMKQAIYVLEKHAPDSLGGKNFTPSRKVQGLANAIRPLLTKVGKDDIDAGVLSSLRKNYFPHVLNMSEETRKAMDDFAKRHPDLSQFNNLNKGNKFDKSRKSFQTLAQRDNYIYKLEKAIQKETDPDTIELLREQLDRVADLFDTDVVSALTRRVREGVRARSMKAMQGELSKFGMMVSNPDDISKTKGLTKLDPATAKKLGLGKGEHYIHEDVLDGMKRIDEIFTDQGMNTAMRTLSAIADIWRPLVTYYKPSHYRNNIIGNTINNLAAGVTPRDVKVAGKLITGYRKGKLTDSQMKIMEAAYKHNVISGGFLFDSKPNFQFDNPTKLEKFAKMVGENKGIKKARSGGEFADDVSRLANFVNGMNKYGNSKKAAEQVRKYLFNYNELTNTDRAMRTFVPFWNWIKRNIPLQVNMLMENPKVAMNVERFKNLFNDEEEGADWQKDMGIKVPQPIANLFGAKDEGYYTSLPSPTNDLNTVMNPLSLLSSISPVPKMAIEGYMNKEMFSGNPISYGEDNVQAEDLPRYLAKNFGITGNFYDAATGKRSIGEAIHNLFNPVYKIKEE